MPSMGNLKRFKSNRTDQDARRTVRGSTRNSGFKSPTARQGSRASHSAADGVDFGDQEALGPVARVGRWADLAVPLSTEELRQLGGCFRGRGHVDADAGQVGDSLVAGL
jgi:hypothetical protein